MAYRGSTAELARGDRWDRDRFMYERDRDRFGDERERFDEREHYSRGPTGRLRESSVDDRFERRTARPYDDDYIARDRRYYDDEPRYRRSSPPPEFERKVVIDKERAREYRSPSPVRRPGALLRRQSSLDTFDRRPTPRFYEREETDPPARRGDYRPEPYQPIPLPRSRALPPPRVYGERDYDEIRISEPERYGDEEYHAYPERMREKEFTRTRQRRDHSGSRTTRARSSRHGSTIRSSSRSSTTTSHSSSSSSGGTTMTVKSEYPKRGKTRIPGRLVSKRALIDLGYPFIEQGNTIVVQKALGQDNIDDLLKLSEDYKKAEVEVEESREVVVAEPPPPPALAPAPTIVEPPPPPPLAPAPATAPVEVVKEVKETVVRDVSPSRYSSTGYATSATPVIVEARPREYSEEIAMGPLALVSDRRREERDIQYEIARLEAERELIRRDRHHHHHHHHHSHSHSPGRELVRAERLSSGELVLYEEKLEKIEEPRRGVRIEKDKRGRMSISVPKYKK